MKPLFWRPGYKKGAGNMEITKTEWMQGFLRMAQDGWEQGWHERNGGNLTYRLRPKKPKACGTR